VTFNLATGQITGENLKANIESNLTAVFSSDTFNHFGGWVDGYSGLDLQLNLASADGERIQSMRLEGTNIDIVDSDVLNVAGCVRPVELDSGTTLCNYGGFTNVTALINPDTNEAWTAIDFLEQQIRLDLLPDTHENHIHDENETLMWPDSEFVQPSSVVGE